MVHLNIWLYFFRCSIGVGKCPNLILSNFSNMLIFMILIKEKDIYIGDEGKVISLVLVHGFLGSSTM